MVRTSVSTGQTATRHGSENMSVDKDFFDSLDQAYEKAEQAGDTDTWKPIEAGEQLKGIFLNVTYVLGDHGWSPVGVIRDIKTEESVKVWFSSGILKERIVDLAPAPGTPVAIRYDGTKKSEKGFNYKLHVVAMPDREEGDVILGREYWDAQEADAHEKEDAKQAERASVQADRPDEAPF